MPSVTRGGRYWRQILTEVLPNLADHVWTHEALWVSDLKVTSLYTLKRNSTMLRCESVC